MCMNDVHKRIRLVCIGSYYYSGPLGIKNMKKNSNRFLCHLLLLHNTADVWRNAL